MESGRLPNGRIWQRGLSPAPWPKDEPFNADRARVMGQHARAALKGEYEGFNELTLVPLESEPNEHRKERREFL